MAALPDATDHIDFQISIRFFQRTMQGFYTNMLLDESLKKSEEPQVQGDPPRRFWLKKGTVQWQEGGLGPMRTMLLALAFHRRDRFDASDNVTDVPHYYLSVGLSDVNLKFDGNGEEYDQDFTDDCVAAIVVKIKETCRDFENRLPAGQTNRLYIAPHRRVKLDQSRLRKVVKAAQDGGYLVQKNALKKVRGIWPSVREQLITGY